MTNWCVEAEHTDWASEATVGEDGVIRNVALCGNASRNGYRIPASAFGSEGDVRSLYDGKGVFFNHLPQELLDRPYQRDMADFAGEVFNTRMQNGRPYGDIRTEGAPKGEQLRQLVKAGYHNVGMSHVAAYRKSQDRATVEQVMCVATVDAVYMPATTNTFSEQTHTVPETDEVTPVMENQDKALALLNFASSGRFGSLIRECMDSQGINTAVMAERLNCDPACLADVVRGGRANPSGERIKSLAEALGISVEQVTEAIHPPAQETGMELKDLTAESLRKERPDLVDALVSDHTATEQAQSELKSLKAELESIQKERESLSQKLEKYEAEQAIARRRAVIQDELKAAELDPNDTVICSEQFMNSLLRVESADDRKELIQDRSALFQHAQESIHRGSAPRHTEGKEEPKPESFIVR